MAKSILYSGHGSSSAPSVGKSLTRYFHCGDSGLIVEITETYLKVPYYSTGTFSNLYIRVITNSFDGDDGNIVFKLRVNSADPSSGPLINIPAATTGEFEDTTNTVSISSGDYINYCMVTPSSILPSPTITFRVMNVSFDVSSNTIVRHVAVDSFSENSVTRYTALAGPYSGDGTEVNRQFNMKASGTLKNLYLYVTSNTAVSSTDFRIRKNAANGNSLITVATLTTGAFEDVTNTDSIAVDDDANYSVTYNSASGSIIFSTLASEFVTTTGEFHSICNGSSYTLSGFIVRYATIGGGGTSHISNQTHARGENNSDEKSIASLYTYVSANTSNNTPNYISVNQEAVIVVQIIIPTTTTGSFEWTGDVTFYPNLDYNYAMQCAAAGKSMTFTIWGIKLQLFQQTFFDHHQHVDKHEEALAY